MKSKLVFLSQLASDIVYFQFTIQTNFMRNIQRHRPVSIERGVRRELEVHRNQWEQHLGRAGCMGRRHLEPDADLDQPSLLVPQARQSQWQA